jgi:cobalt-zinc-cadmium efflux system membrane fusion protein
MKLSITSKQLGMIALIVFAGLVLAMLLLNQDNATHGESTPAVNAGHLPQDEHDHETLSEEPPRGPHGGRLLSQNDYAIEVSIFEQNVPPQFRLYTFLNGEQLDPAASSVVLELQRLGRPAERFEFVKEEDYLKSGKVVEEPHSFEASLSATHAGKNYRFAYEQIEARVDMTDRQLELNNIEILTAGPATIQSTLNLIGEIKLNADRAVTVVPRLAGIVEAVKVSAGDTVKKGQVLAVIDSQSLADQRSELMAAQKRLDLARTTHEREKMLWEERISAEQDYLAARQAMQAAQIDVDSAKQKLQAIGIVGNAGGNLTRYEIRAPIDGVIAEKQIAVGQVTREDTPVFVVADLATVWAEMTVYAKDLGTVRPGQQVTVEATAFDATASGTVSYLSPLVGNTSRTATARVVLPNPEGLWRPGLAVTGELVSEEVEVPIAVSTEGLQSLRDWQVVFARYGQQFEARPLKLGRGDDRYVEVLEGLLPGERYAAHNSFLIKAELGKAGASHDH